MKRIISIYLILLLSISIYGCKSTADDAYQTEIDGVQLEPSLETASRYATDVFIATIKSSKPISNNVEFPNFTLITQNPGLYTVSVGKVIRSLAVTENTEIEVCHTLTETSEDEYYVHEFEIGETYIIAGTVQPYNDKPIIVDNVLLTAKIEDDGTLTPISKAASKTLAGINTLDELLENEKMQRIAETEPSLLPSVF